MATQAVNASQLRHVTCGSGLAREEGIAFNINVDCDAAFASKLAPTRIAVLKLLTDKH